MVGGSALSALVIIPLINWWGSGMSAPLYPETEHLIEVALELEERADRATGDDTGTGTGREQHDSCSTISSVDPVRNRAFDHGDGAIEVVRDL